MTINPSPRKKGLLKPFHQFSLLCLLFISLGCTQETSFAQHPMPKPEWTPVALPSVVEGQPLPSLAPMLAKTTPAVVNIASARTEVVNNPLFSDPFFRHFFNITPAERKTQSRGSGVIIDAKNGYVITNYHVIEAATEIMITLQDGRELKAKVIGNDPETDVALMQIPSEQLSALPLANSEELRVGDFVVAIGNPFGLGQTVTSGIVSALGRTGLGIEGYEDFIQTDASINPGNSGGALVNLRGELVGMNTAIIAPGGGNVGIGFAIPSNMVRSIVQHLIEFGEVKRGILGIKVQDLTPDLVSAFGLQDSKGALISEVDKKSPAEAAGLQSGDIILALNNQPVNRSSDVRNKLGLLRIGEQVTLTVFRKGKKLEFKAVIAGLVSLSGAEVNPYLEGVNLVETDEGVRLEQVQKDSVAWQIGLRPKDIIIGLGRQKVTNFKDLQNLLQDRPPPFSLILQRDKSIITLMVR